MDDNGCSYKSSLYFTNWSMEESSQEALRINERLFYFIPRDILDIPKDVLELLCDRLSISEQLQFARVCKSWHSVAFKRVNPKAHEPPSLIGLSNDPTLFGRRIHNQITCYQIQPKSFQHSDPYIIGSFKGWLCLQYYKEELIQLVNLFSNIHLDLPSLSTMKFIPSHKSLSLVGPSKHAKAFAVLFCRFLSPIMIAFVSKYGKLALCEIGGSAWEAHETDEQYVNVAFYNNKLYAIRKKYNKVDIFEIDHDLKLFHVGAIEIDNDIKLFPLAVAGSSRVTNAKWDLPFQSYLVVEPQENNLFLVMHHRKEVKVDFLTVEFEIYKVYEDRLVKVDTLGDQIVLLNDSCSEIINVKDCPPSLLFRGNQICFTSNLNKNIGIYSFKDGIVNWLPPFRTFYGIHWMLPRLVGKCTSESHTSMCCPKLSEPP
ncbi:uncharacterized protein LOC129320387 isoform X2 [Prosopis cineraria]|uniref:uncharacterized protein LOC129320387 isoform X2 n=1 Tax=Prosopis cineraria TaxID=364024 RepID=UPI00240EC191|nr:uncharacterized protein LOC129320387 isoform X2 [Prosopis cineraria]